MPQFWTYIYDLLFVFDKLRKLRWTPFLPRTPEQVFGGDLRLGPYPKPNQTLISVVFDLDKYKIKLL